MHLICIREYICKLDGGGDFVSLRQCDSDTHAQWPQRMPFRPTVTVYDFIHSADPGMQKMILGASNVPDGVADLILTRTGACEPLFLRQIIRIVVDDAIQIGELLF